MKDSPSPTTGLDATGLKPFELKGYYRHKYGGLYLFVGLNFEDKGAPTARYRHVWPFEEQDYERPLSEFRERFVSIPEHEVVQARAGDRTQAQALVVQAKTAGRS